jgi:uncharacterized cupredoxin-like copper-binding protein
LLRRNLSTTAALALLCAAALGGCGGSPDFVTDRDGTLQITLSEYRLQPENIRVRPGRLHIVARNRGQLTHNLEVQSLNRDPGEPPYSFGRTDTAHPGETVTRSLDLRPGKYRLVCTIANHDDLGQFGELQVVG